MKIGLVQINNSFSGQSYLPYSVALLQSYVLANAKDPSRYEFLMPIFSRLRVEEAVEKLLSADIALFSIYVWNVRISLEIAKRLKAAKPSVKIVLGGPQVPDRAESFVKENPFVDLFVHGEGEQVALQILEASDPSEWKKLGGVSFLDKGTVVTNPKGPRIKDINVVPSPFLNGVFDSVMAAHPDQKWIALWETNRGCPFSCTFCDWGSSTQSRVYQFEIGRLNREVEWFAKHKIDFVFCCDANFGILPRDLDIAQYVAEIKKTTGYPKALSVQNTKNAIGRSYQVQKTLADSGLNKGVTLSMQSVDPSTLENIKRQNISLDGYQDLQRRFTRDRVETYTDLILGLPGETYDSFASGVDTVIENGQHNRIQFNNLSILPNAEMGDPEYQKKYGMVTIESDIINIHGSLRDIEHEILEKQQLVVATGSMPREEWVRTRAFCWMVALVHFDKILQIPIILLRKLSGLRYRQIFELFTEGDLKEYPTLSEVRSFFIQMARDIQSGKPEYHHSKKYLDIYWPADEWILIKLISEKRIDSFYSEARRLILKHLPKDKPELVDIFEDAIRLNQSLLKLPFQDSDLEVRTHYNVWAVYRAALIGEDLALEKTPCEYHIDRTSLVWKSWDDYCREVIWYGNKKGAYLYNNLSAEKQIAGIY